MKDYPRIPGVLIKSHHVQKPPARYLILIFSAICLQAKNAAEKSGRPLPVEGHLDIILY
jgi:hypothetical protein